jgi:uncharacterized protein YjbJ (UPF0337 family)
VLFCGRVTQLLLTWGKCNGNYIDRSSRFVFARRWELGVFPLAQELALSWRAVRPKDASPGAGIQISSEGGNKVKPSTENEIAGKVHEVKGAIKEKVGQLTNDPGLEEEGTGEKIGGKVQKKIGQVQKVLGE